MTPMSNIYHSDQDQLMASDEVVSYVHHVGHTDGPILSKYVQACFSRVRECTAST